MSLKLNIFTDYIGGHFITDTANEVAVIPQLSSPELFSQLGELLERFSRRDAFHDLHHLCRRVFRWCFNKDMYVVFHYLHCIYAQLILFGNVPKDLLYISRNLPFQYMLPVLRYPYQMVLQIIHGMVRPSNTHAAVIQEKTLLKQVPLPRLTASHFPPASKLAGIQWGFL